MGARFQVVHTAKQPRAMLLDYAMDIEHDGAGAYFALRVPESMERELMVNVMQVQKHDRHLLLMVRKDGATKDRFLCGHDEREWFVAAVPGGASSVIQAKEALKPMAVLQAQSRKGLKGKQRNLRKNPAFRRQGEWFFIEEPGLVVDPKVILRHEPLRRGAGKPHMCAELFRSGGEIVYVHRRYPNGVDTERHRQLVNSGKTHRGEWRTMRRNAGVFVRGEVRHSDHKTITLHTWHQVLMNTENQSRTMAKVAFLD